MKILKFSSSIFLFVLIALGACQPKKENFPAFIQEVSPLFDESLKPFYHGVASGDPLVDRVIIWTRVTPQDSVPSIDVTWEVSENENFSSVLTSGKLTTTPARDYTVKVDVTGLQPDKKYYYRFTALEKISPTGKTKTTPTGTRDSLKFAVVSCANWEFGYFNAYGAIAQKEIDAVLHLGDYIYEYATGKYGDTTIGRFNLPKHEIVTLQDYRTRHSQYRLDQGLRELSQAHPIIAIWDDHEIANDAYAEGAQNHQAEEGEYAKRKAAAVQSYYEWLPVREGTKLYRTVSYGPLADLIMLDERLEGRSKQAETLSDPDLNNSQRTMLGNEQFNWLTAQLETSKAQWKIIGNQVIFSKLDESFNESAKSVDNWNGYPAEQVKLSTFLKDKKLKDVVFLTGDTHASWAFEVLENKPNSKEPVAVEFGTTSISSGNWDERYNLDTARLGEQLYQKFNPHLKYVNGVDHGYMLLTIYPDKAKAEWFYVETLRKRDLTERLAKQMQVAKGTTTLK
jgi:alkaline phosphatase D